MRARRPRILPALLALLILIPACGGPERGADSLLVFVTRFEMPFGESYLYTYSMPDLRLRGKTKVNSMATRLAAPPALDQVWLSGETGRDILIFDTLGDSILRTIPAQGPAGAGAFGPDGGRFLFANSAVLTRRLRSNFVNLIDVSARESLARIEVGDDPRGVCFSPDGAAAFVANTGDASVSRIDVAAGRVDGTFPCAAGPVHLGCDPRGRWLYVACLGEQSGDAARAPGVLQVFALPSLELVASLDAGRHPSRVNCLPDGGRIVVSEMRGGADDPPARLRVFSVTGERVPDFTLLHEIDIGPNSLAGDISPDGRWFIAPDFDTSALTLVDLDTGEIARRITLPDAGRAVHAVDAVFGLGRRP